jgi:lactate permease
VVLVEADLPITLINWLLALVPIVVLLVLLVVLRWTAAQAGAVGFFVAALIAWLVFQSDAEVLSVATGKGIWDGVFILLVVWPALMLYEVSDKAGAFDVLRKGITKFTESKLMLTLAFGWVFVCFLQGIAGFGTPIAIVAPLLVGLGMRPVMAVAVPLIGHAFANMFGTLAVGWLATLQVVELNNQTATALETAALLWIPNILSGLAIAWMYGRGKAVMKALPVIGVITLIHGGGQLALAGVNPIISNFIPTTVALGAILAMMRIPAYNKPDDIETDMYEESGKDEGSEEGDPEYSLTLAMSPYFVLIAVSLLVLVVPPVNQYLEQFEVGLPFPGVETGFGVEQAAEENYGSIEVFTHPGLLLLFSAIVGYAIFKSKKLYKDNFAGKAWSGLVGNALPASVAVLGFLTLSTIMDHSGMTTVLAQGIANVAPPMVYAFAANWIGVLGAFMTSSNTASNILFGPLQSEAAQAAAINQSAIIGAQSTGGAIGNAIAPANVVLGTGTAKISGQEGEVLRKTLPYAVVASVLVGIATILLLLFTG